MRAIEAQPKAYEEYQSWSPTDRKTAQWADVFTRKSYRANNPFAHCHLRKA